MTAVRPSDATFALVWERDDGRCAFCGGHVHGTRGFDFSLHHRRPAGAGGDRRPETHAASNLVLLDGHGTSFCHGEIESRRTDAQARGFLIPKLSITPPQTWSIEHAVHGWCYLLDDGSIAYDPPEVAA